jgi:tetratricopeptide (TPR) repeat protein
MAPSCFVGWLGIVPTVVPDQWIDGLPFGEAYEALREPVSAWDRYNDEVESALRRACEANEHRGTRMTYLRVRGDDGSMVDKLTEVPADTWYAEISPETLEHFITQLERFADRFEAAMERYQPQRNYLLYLSILAVLAWLALGALMGLVGATALQDLQRKLLGLDEVDSREQPPTPGSLGKQSTLAQQVETLQAEAERANDRGDFATAIRAYRTAIVTAPREDLIDALAALHMRRGRPNDAQDAAFLYLQMSKRVPAEQASALLDRALECDPDCEEALTALQALRDEAEQGRSR